MSERAGRRIEEAQRCIECDGAGVVQVLDGDREAKRPCPSGCRRNDGSTEEPPGYAGWRCDHYRGMRWR